MERNGFVKQQLLRVSEVHRPSHAPARPPAVVASRLSPQTPVVEAQGERKVLPPAAEVPDAAAIERIKEMARLEGLAQGRKQAQQEAAEAVRDKLASLQAVMLSVEAAWQTERVRIEALLGDFAFVAVNRLLGDCLREPGAAVAAVRATLADCDITQVLTVEVHPRDVGPVTAALSGNDDASAASTVRIVASEAVDVGGCRICTQGGSLDARLEVQLAQLRERLDAERTE
jgi:flagellar biosynthesis/type III secretory pathway protein FliH